ncbi:hypothetical protein SNEBB_010436 [Seison nebaliae]|nr:hypothetical protein SNEBB_010436 [Seison nebaliae]
MSTKILSVYDYVTFSLLLSLSVFVGLYFAIERFRKDRRTKQRKDFDKNVSQPSTAKEEQEDIKDFLVASESLGAFPLAISILASFFSASTLLGTPAEVYKYGLFFFLSTTGIVIAPIVGALVFGPFFRRLKVVSVFEYLERRFHISIKYFGSLIYIMRALLACGMVLYGPAIAISGVTTFDTTLAIIVIGIGGMRAVIWTDVVQTGIMFLGMLLVIFIGTSKIGGWSNTFSIIKKQGKLNFPSSGENLINRYTYTNMMIGTIFNWMFPYAIDQQVIQRFSAAKTVLHGRIAFLLNIPGGVFLMLICTITGLIMSAYFRNGDPLKHRYITNSNQLLPYFVLDLLGNARGVTGIFLAAIFSGSLSSVSSILNALSTITWQDYIEPIWQKKFERFIKPILITKLLVAFYGAIGIAFALMFSKYPDTLVTMSYKFNGALGSPLLGLFILGSLFSFTNSIGAGIGTLFGLAVALSNAFGDTISKDPNNYFFHISFMWYSLIGFSATVLCGGIVSLITGGYRNRIDESLLLLSKSSSHTE